ncbi:hypothetical protein FB451DRAFT_1191958 [Mycena latifolia]|nr:hypothetical protein FB451DRAFT_1191958 [Mycena latifolia]
MSDPLLFLPLKLTPSRRARLRPTRPRASIACASCRKRKVKCTPSSIAPDDPCTGCMRRGSSCEYLTIPEQMHRAPPRRSTSTAEAPYTFPPPRHEALRRPPSWVAFRTLHCPAPQPTTDLHPPHRSNCAPLSLPTSMCAYVTRPPFPGFFLDGADLKTTYQGDLAMDEQRRTVQPSAMSSCNITS